MRKWYKKCPFCANEIKEWAVKCPFCEEFLDWRSKKNDELLNNKPKEEKKIVGKLRRFLVVIYFVLSLPIFWLIVFLSSENYSIYYRWLNFRNYYYLILILLSSIIIYTLFTNLIKRICSYISNWSFKGFINYKKFWPFLLAILIIIFSLLYFSNNFKNKVHYSCQWEWEILNIDFSCTCDEWYEINDWLCKKSEFKYVTDATWTYIKEHNLNKSIWNMYVLDMVKINNNEWLMLFVDTSIKWWSNPVEINSKYIDDWRTCPSQVEWISSAKWQWYIVAYENYSNEYVINDFFQIPLFHPYIDEYIGALSYPVLNTKMGNFLSYDGEEPKSVDEYWLVEPTKIINFRDIDWDWKKLEFYLMNYEDQVCWTYNYLFLWYDDTNKKIKEYFFNNQYEKDYYNSWISLTDWSQNLFTWWILKQQYFWWSAHRWPCDESREYKYRKNWEYNYFDIKNYKKWKCEDEY